MNRITLYSLIFILFIYFCKSNKKLIEVNQNIDKQNIILRLSKKYNKVFRVKIPIEIELKNNSIKKQDLITIQYDYGTNKSIIEFLYKKSEKGLREIESNKKKSIKPYSSEYFILYTSHKLDSSSSTQKQLVPYVEKMLQEKKDTLHIGTVSEFRKKHKELFEKLTKNDSISIQLLNNGKFGERITVPVEW